MARNKPFHFQELITADLKDLARQFKGVAADVKAALHEARQHPAVKMCAHEARQTASEVEAELQHLRDGIKQALKTVGAQIGAIFKDAGERLADLNEQAAAQAPQAPQSAAATAADGSDGVPESSHYPPAEAELTVVGVAQETQDPIHA